VQALREPAYYAKQSQMITGLITAVGTLIAVVMALGAVFGALNTMYSAVSERSREIAVLRAIGFGGVRSCSRLRRVPDHRVRGGLVGCVAVLR